MKHFGFCISGRGKFFTFTSKIVFRAIFTALGVLTTRSLIYGVRFPKGPIGAIKTSKDVKK